MGCYAPEVSCSQDIEVFETASDGTFVCRSRFRTAGYSLHEQAIERRLPLNQTPVFFEVTDDSPVIEIKFPNEPAMGQITLTKKGPVFAGIQEEEIRVWHHNAADFPGPKNCRMCVRDSRQNRYCHT